MTYSGWLTTTLILLPLGGALAVWLLPWSRIWAGSVAFLVSLFEIGFWIWALVRFDFSRPGVQLQERTTWIMDLGVSYHVGFLAYGLWLAGLTVVVMAAAVGYAFWSGRERPRAYFGLMLFLTGAIVGVFAAQDLLLFYVFWEAMLIPLYELEHVDLPRLRRRLRRQGAALPAPRLAAGCLPGVFAGGGCGLVWCRLQGGDVRLPLHLHHEAARADEGRAL